MKKHKCINCGTLIICGNKEDIRKAINDHKKICKGHIKFVGQEK